MTVVYNCGWEHSEESSREMKTLQLTDDAKEQEIKEQRKSSRAEAMENREPTNRKNARVMMVMKPFHSRMVYIYYYYVRLIMNIVYEKKLEAWRKGMGKLKWGI